MASELTVNCPICKQQFETPQNSIGDLVTCPHCKKHFQLSAMMTEERTEPPKPKTEAAPAVAVHDLSEPVSRDDFRLFLIGGLLAPFVIGVPILMYTAWRAYSH